MLDSSAAIVLSDFITVCRSIPDWPHTDVKEALVGVLRDLPKEFLAVKGLLELAVLAFAVLAHAPELLGALGHSDDAEPGPQKIRLVIHSGLTAAAALPLRRGCLQQGFKAAQGCAEDGQVRLALNLRGDL